MRFSLEDSSYSGTMIEVPQVRVAPIDTSQRIERSALRLFYARGYEGTSVRKIAAGADIAVATMFHHYPTKSVILETLLHRIVDQIQNELEDALVDAANPADRLSRFVRVVVIAHCLRSDESFVAERELRFLPPAAQDPILAKRRMIRAQIHDIVEAGRNANLFLVDENRTAAIAILTMCTSVASWYRKERDLDPETLAGHYIDYARQIVRFDPTVSI